MELASVVSIEPRPDFFGYVHGNTVAFAGWVAISWLVGGFSEELLFRGFLLSKIGRMFRSPVVGMVAGLTAQALLFGSLHKSKPQKSHTAPRKFGENLLGRKSGRTVRSRSSRLVSRSCELNHCTQLR